MAKTSLLAQKNYNKTKWKNGRGETFEIARYPVEGPYLWRLSMAPVLENGPFSCFPNFDRYITLVEGNGLKLKEKVINVGEVFKFSGDENTYGELIDGQIIDLNLIVKRDKVKAKFEVLKLAQEQFSYKLKGKVVLIFGLSGQINISTEKSKFILDQKSTLQIDNPSNEPLIFKELFLNSSCVLIELDW